MADVEDNNQKTGLLLIGIGLVMSHWPPVKRLVRLKWLISGAMKHILHYGPRSN